jgi:hypothetical protein
VPWIWTHGLGFDGEIFVTAICSGSRVFRLCVRLGFSCLWRRDFLLLLFRHAPRSLFACDFPTGWFPARSPRSDPLQRGRFRAHRLCSGQAVFSFLSACVEGAAKSCCCLVSVLKSPRLVQFVLRSGARQISFYAP